MLTFLLRRVLPGRLVPLLALWEVYTAARWLNGLRTNAQRRHRPTRLASRASQCDPTEVHRPDPVRPRHEAPATDGPFSLSRSQATPHTVGRSSHPRPMAHAMTDLMDRPFLYQEADDDQPDETDRGLVYDLVTLDRRRMLKLLGFGGVSAGAVRDRRLRASRVVRRPRRPRRASAAARAPRARAARSSPRRPPARSRATAPTAPTSSTRAASSAGHPLELRLVDDGRRGRAR